MEALKEKEEIKRERELLKKYLSQYTRKKTRKKTLEKRLKTFDEEMIGPKSMNLSPMPRSVTNNTTNEPLDFVTRKEEIKERIEQQRKEAQSLMLKVLDVLDFLIQDSNERNILEYRYIDCMQWSEVSKEYFMSRSQCIEYGNAGLDKLIEFEKIRKILDEFEEGMKEAEDDS